MIKLTISRFTHFWICTSFLSKYKHEDIINSAELRDGIYHPSRWLWIRRFEEWMQARYFTHQWDL